jgi:hypothetical protein
MHDENDEEYGGGDRTEDHRVDDFGDEDTKKTGEEPEYAAWVVSILRKMR